MIIPTMDRGGAEKQLCLLATHLSRDEFDVHVILLTRDGPYSEILRDCRYSRDRDRQTVQSRIQRPLSGCVNNSTFVTRLSSTLGFLRPTVLDALRQN